MVVHVHTDGTSTRPPRVGLVVSKAVGDAVTRNRVKRRLRHQVAPLLTTLPPGTTVVLRALPLAAHADSADLAQELQEGLARCVGRTPEMSR